MIRKTNIITIEVILFFFVSAKKQKQHQHTNKHTVRKTKHETRTHKKKLKKERQTVSNRMLSFGFTIRIEDNISLNKKRERHTTE